MHFSCMKDVFRQGATVNHNIVKVYNDEFAFHWLQDGVHSTHELARCVCQAKWPNCHSYKPNLVVQAVFCLSAVAIRI